MLKYLSSYLQPIVVACAFFPAIAALFTLPFVIRHYRKYGGIAVMRTIVVYSFILYCMCAFLLTVLPLPSREAVMAMPDHPIRWIPGYDWYVGMKKIGFNSDNLTSLGLWKKFFTSSDFFQILFNIVMTVPLGLYLRYYFRFTLRETILAGFCASLFFEVTQYTALYGYYPKPYRYTEVDDLINNTLGAVIGYAVQPLICKILPTRDEIDRISYKKGERVTILRRLFAYVIDLVLCNIVYAVVEIFAPVSVVNVLVTLFIWWLTMIAYFGIFPCITRGRTPGQMILRLKTVDENGGKPRLKQIIRRNALLYGLEFFLLYLSGCMIASFIVVAFMADNSMPVIMITAVICMVPVVALSSFILVCEKKWNKMPHSHFSHTDEVSYGIGSAETVQ
ncbi:MAG: VanZ family protein [Eubacterium sp.]|nr:VanZ family protein [Eubacterium sp.]